MPKSIISKDIAAVSAANVKATLMAAERTGLIGDKNDRISARLSHALIEQAKKRTGIQGDTELLEFALANIALEDRFNEAITKLDGTVDADIKLGF